MDNREFASYRQFVLNEINRIRIGRLTELIRMKDYPAKDKMIRENEVGNICEKMRGIILGGTNAKEMREKSKKPFPLTDKDGRN